ncbi:hypothetical protein HK098_000117 [Nowakowskiella sp. JEL0407]|nr:hypothetical protein HK098_000117 [Nowakowskiella sp. JEL0407]
MLERETDNLGKIRRKLSAALSQLGDSTNLSFYCNVGASRCLHPGLFGAVIFSTNSSPNLFAIQNPHFPKFSPYIHPTRNLALSCKSLYHIISPFLYSEIDTDLTCDPHLFQELINNNSNLLDNLIEHLTVYVARLEPIQSSTLYPFRNLTTLKATFTSCNRKNIDAIQRIGELYRKLKVLELNELYLNFEWLEAIGSILHNLDLHCLSLEFRYRNRSDKRIEDGMKLLAGGVSHLSSLVRFRLCAEDSDEIFFQHRDELRNLFDVLRTIGTLTTFECETLVLFEPCDSIVELIKERNLKTLVLNHFPVPIKVVDAIRNCKSLETVRLQTFPSNFYHLLKSPKQLPKNLSVMSKFNDYTTIDFPIDFRGLESLSIRYPNCNMDSQVFQQLGACETLKELECDVELYNDFEDLSAVPAFTNFIRSSQSLRILRFHTHSMLRSPHLDEIFDSFQYRNSIKVLKLMVIPKNVYHIIRLLETNTVLEELVVTNVRIVKLWSMLQAIEKNKSSCLKRIEFEGGAVVQLDVSRPYLHVFNYTIVHDDIVPTVRDIFKCWIGEETQNCWKYENFIMDRIVLDGLSRSEFQLFKVEFKDWLKNGVNIGYIDGELCCTFGRSK